MSQSSGAQRAGASRLTFIDGLRGVAIAMVVLFHGWSHSAVTAGNPVGRLMSQGYEGVSLFLVVSGFCLAFAPLARRSAGKRQWFTPSEFFARRCLRILPPYYAALVLFTLIKVVQARHGTLATISKDPPPNLASVVSHVLLIHNLTPYIFSIAGPFWSLALEWQWYWFFPWLLALCIRSRGLTLLLCVGLLALWHWQAHDLWGIGALPARLFEFCAGVVAAYLATQRRVPRSPLLAIGFILPLALMCVCENTTIARFPVSDAWITQPLFGIAFASLLLLGYENAIAGAILSWRPLVGLGLVSYSVYLIHQPVLDNAMARLHADAPHHEWLVMLAGIVCALAAGVVLHFTVERPSMSRGTWVRSAPYLTRMFHGLDHIWLHEDRAEYRLGREAVPVAVTD